MKLPNQIIWISVNGAIAVALGALGAHYLKAQIEMGTMTQDLLLGFDTAVKYQMYHTLAMLVVVLLQFQVQSTYLKWANNLFLTGIILFSGSLYFLCTRHLLGMEWLRFLGPVTPVGGLFFISGWLCLGWAAYKKG